MEIPVFSDPSLDADTRKILQPFVEWAKGMAQMCKTLV